VSSRTLPECTAAAVTEHLIAAGFLISTEGELGPGWRSAGVYAAGLPMPEPRVAVCFWPGSPAAGQCEEVARPLNAAGYQAGRVAGRPRDYLAAWTEGQS
jgi:hypothetical protein